MFITKFLKIIGTIAALTFYASFAHAAEYKIVISLETSPNHLRNLSVVKFADLLKERSGGRLEVQVFHGASQYKGTNVPTALAQGALDMGIPGTWHLGKFIPEFNLPGLPMFYGLGRDAQYTVFDGAVGQELVSRLEKKLGVKVIGRWIDLGFGELFFVNKKVEVPADIKGMKIRAPGGAAHIARFSTLDATATKIAFPDVPQALQRGTVDGLLTTHESVRSAKLWDAGLKHAYDDNETFFQYVPVMSLKAWNGLPEDIQKLVVDSWEKSVGTMRSFAKQKQQDARRINGENGIALVVGNPADLKKVKDTLLAGQDKLVKKLGMDPTLVKQAKSILDAM